jgi:uncharacterized membrane protein (UPF0136 family)
MKTIIALAVAALASAHAISLPETRLLESRDSQPVSLIFQAGPVSYGMQLAADGQEYFTSMLKELTGILGFHRHSSLPLWLEPFQVVIGQPLGIH